MREGIASALQVLGSVAREQGRYDRSARLHAESLAIAEAAGDRWAARGRGQERGDGNLAALSHCE